MGCNVYLSDYHKTRPDGGLDIDTDAYDKAKAKCDEENDEAAEREAARLERENAIKGAENRIRKLRDEDIPAAKERLKTLNDTEIPAAKTALENAKKLLGQAEENLKKKTEEFDARTEDVNVNLPGQFEQKRATEENSFNTENEKLENKFIQDKQEKELWNENEKTNINNYYGTRENNLGTSQRGEAPGQNPNIPPSRPGSVRTIIKKKKKSGVGNKISTISTFGRGK